MNFILTIYLVTLINGQLNDQKFKVPEKTMEICETEKVAAWTNLQKHDEVIVGVVDCGPSGDDKDTPPISPK